MSEQEGSEYSALEISKSDNQGHEGPGARLKLLRQAKNIDLVEMAKQLRLSPQRLEQIESDDYSGMGSGAFARGYLRGYARSLGMGDVEVNELMLLFRSLNLEAGIHTNKPHLINEKIEHNNPRITRRLIWLLIIGLSFVTAFWWHKHSLITDKVVAEKTSIPTASASKDTAEIMTLPPQQVSPAAPANATTTVTMQPLPPQPASVPAENQALPAVATPELAPAEDMADDNLPAPTKRKARGG